MDHGLSWFHSQPRVQSVTARVTVRESRVMRDRRMVMNTAKGAQFMQAISSGISPVCGYGIMRQGGQP